MTYGLIDSIREDLPQVDNPLIFNCSCNTSYCQDGREGPKNVLQLEELSGYICVKTIATPLIGVEDR